MKNGMKKALAVIPLIIGSFLILGALLWLTCFAALRGFFFGSFGVLIAIVIVGATAYGMNRVRLVFKQKFGLSAPKFFLCVYLPPILGAVAHLIWFLNAKSKDYQYFIPWQIDFITCIIYLIAAITLPIFGAVWYFHRSDVNES